MATITVEQRNPVPKFLLVLMMLGITIMFVATIFSKHATEKHGQDAWEVRKCLSQNGPIETWENKETGRTAEIVCLPDGRYGIQVCDGKFEVTCFVKEKMSKFRQVASYLRNSGYSK